MSQTPAGESGALRLRQPALAAAVLLFAAVLAFDAVHLDRGFLDKWTPRLDGAHWGRSLLLLASAACLVAALPAPRLSDLAATFRAWRGLQWLLVGGWLSLLLFSLGDPARFDSWSREARVFENLSAAALLCAAVASGAAAGLARRARLDRRIVLGAAGLAGVCFLVGMEEISWGQHWLGFEAPAFFTATNDQREFNLHNYATWEFEMAYYAGGFLFLTLIPWLADAGGLVRGSWLATFVPGRAILLVFAIQSAYCRLIWDVSLGQWMFFASVLILARYTRAAWAAGREALPLAGFGAAMIAVCLATQAHFLLTTGLQRQTAVSEYREFLIALGIAFASVGILLRVWRSARGLSPPATRPG